MILLNKKKMIFILSCMILSVLFYSFTSLPHSTIETSSTPVSNHVVILDAGHGVPDVKGPLLK